jgi:hypothetical protein
MGAWTEAWKVMDNPKIGELLGYPECCRKFFQRVWVDEKWFDTTIPQASDLQQIDRYSNILWRWHGVRLVSHLPCSFNCRATHEIGERMLYEFEKLDMEASRWVFDILDWPVRYTSLHGIAEITTPVNRFHVATDAIAEKVTVDYKGRTYPAEGASGGFPHRTNLFSVSAKPIHLNGFTSKAAMDAAHATLLQVLGPKRWGTVIDLGCGDGTLLSKVNADVKIGVEKDPEIYKLAAARGYEVWQMDVQDQESVQSLIDEVYPDLIIAQWDRNPVGTLNTTGQVLYYTYEGNVQALLGPILGSPERDSAPEHPKALLDKSETNHAN